MAEPQTYDAGTVVHDVEHGSVVATALLSFSEALDADALAAWLGALMEEHGAAIVRIKGIVRVVGHERPIAVHGEHGVIEPPKFLAEWPAELAFSSIVFILNGLDGATLHDSASAAGLRVLMTGVETHPLHVLG